MNPENPNFDEHLPHPAFDSQADAQPADKHAKILVVDDNIVIVEAISIKLRSAGYEVVTALDGPDALSTVREELPDLVVLDISFPPDVVSVLSDGFRILEWLRHMTGSQRIPVILITGDEQVSNERALAAGATAFFRKPLDHDELLKTIQESLGKSRSQAIQKKASAIHRGAA